MIRHDFQFCRELVSFRILKIKHLVNIVKCIAKHLYFSITGGFNCCVFFLHLDNFQLSDFTFDPDEDLSATFREWVRTPARNDAGPITSMEIIINHFKSYKRFEHLANIHFFNYGDMKRDLPAAVTRLAQVLGIEITEASTERLVGTMPVEGNTQPHGLLHGGASAALAETLGSFAAMLHALPDGVAMGVDLSITHHRSVKSGVVTGVATPLYLGKSTATYQVDVTDEDGSRVATARITCAIRKPS